MLQYVTTYSWECKLKSQITTLFVHCFTNNCWMLAFGCSQLSWRRYDHWTIRKLERYLLWLKPMIGWSRRVKKSIFKWTEASSECCEFFHKPVFEQKLARITRFLSKNINVWDSDKVCRLVATVLHLSLAKSKHFGFYIWKIVLLYLSTLLFNQ